MYLARYQVYLARLNPYLARYESYLARYLWYLARKFEANLSFRGLGRVNTPEYSGLNLLPIPGRKANDAALAFFPSRLTELPKAGVPV